MSSLALGGKPRRWITKIHRWTGLAVLAFLLIAGITGSILAFRGELDRLLNPRLFVVVPQAAPLPYGRLIRAVEARFPDTLVSTVTLPRQADEAAIVFLKAKMDAHVAHVHVAGMKSRVDFNQVFVNPYTAEILGQRNTTRFVLARENFIPVLARLHAYLLLQEWGGWFMGVCALVWFLSSLLGLALAWPRRYRQWAGWRPMLAVRRGTGGYKLNYDLHRAASLVTLPVLIVVAFTSVFLNLPQLVKPAVAHFSPLFSASSLPVAAHLDLDAPTVSPEQAIATARAALPGARVHSIGRDYAKGLYNIRLQLPGDVSPAGNNNAYVRMDDGSLVRLRTAAGASAGDSFAAWQYPLHSGRAFGLAGQILICVAALALVAMCVTGFNIWLRKHRAEGRRSLRRPSAAPEMQEIAA